MSIVTKPASAGSGVYLHRRPKNARPCEYWCVSLFKASSASRSLYARMCLSPRDNGSNNTCSSAGLGRSWEALYPPGQGREEKRKGWIRHVCETTKSKRAINCAQAIDPALVWNHYCSSGFQQVNWMNCHASTW